MRRAVGLAALLVLVASCKMGPDYKRPVIESPEDYREAAPSETTLANLDWWTVFEDPVLRELIETALAENKDLLAAAWRVDAARAQLGFVKSQMWPSFRYQRPSYTSLSVQMTPLPMEQGSASRPMTRSASRRGSLGIRTWR